MITINFNKKLFTKKYKKWISLCYKEAEKVFKFEKKPLEINIAFVSKKEIKFLNNNFRKIDKVTDVLSFPQIIIPDINHFKISDFPHDINQETGNLMLGDLYICVSKVKKQRKEYGTSLQREMSYMAIHGLLHVLGYDHIEDSDKIVMRKQEEKILSRLNIVR